MLEQFMIQLQDCQNELDGAKNAIMDNAVKTRSDINNLKSNNNNISSKDERNNRQQIYIKSYKMLDEVVNKLIKCSTDYLDTNIPELNDLIEKTLNIYKSVKDLAKFLGVASEKQVMIDSYMALLENKVKAKNTTNQIKEMIMQGNEVNKNQTSAEENLPENQEENLHKNQLGQQRVRKLVFSNNNVA